MDINFILVCLATFASVALFVWAGVRMSARGWTGYEDSYVGGMDRQLDAMYLTIPRDTLVYLAVTASFIVGALAGFGFGNVILGVIMGAVALPLPLVVVRVLKARRDAKFNAQLVDALFGMGNALRAGMSLPLAFEMIAREMGNPMGQEMRIVVQEMRVGVTMEDSLRNLATRMPSEDLDLLISAILISREVGGNLTEIFDNIAHTIRERLRLKSKVNALTAQGRLQGIVVACLPVGIGLILNAIHPEFFRPMYTTWMGAAFLGVIVVLELIGAYFIYRIVSIKI